MAKCSQELEMSQAFERLWTSFFNTDGIRRFAKRGVGSVLFNSRIYQTLNLARRYFLTYLQVRRNPGFFQDVNTFCVIIGHNKSGASMIGSLLDAHPYIALSDEADALQYVSAGFSRDQIFHLLLKGSRREFIKGRVTARRLQPYSFLVPGQWQGRFKKLRVIGDSTSGTSTRRLARDPDLSLRLRKIMGETRVKYIHVIRNPYDPISLIMVRGKRSFENAVEHYFTNCATLAEMRKSLSSSDLCAVRYEDFIRYPETCLSEILSFLGLEAGADYLKACTGILYKTPDQSRHMVEWDARWIEAVKTGIEQYDFLCGYSYES
jgi:hypothetical protein